jgi:hypothetical protein
MRSGRMAMVLLALLLALALPGSGDVAGAQDGTAQPSLLLYNTVESLLAGDLLHTVTIGEVDHDLAAFPPGWPVVGVGTTNGSGRNGELMPQGTAAALHYWWADPDPPTEATIRDLADWRTDAALDGQPYLPFVGLAVGDPATAVTLQAENVDDVHAWLADRLAAEGIALAGVRLEGAFGPVQTTVAYNIPLTGLDLSGGYVGADYFRFGDYAPADWTMVGLYAAAPALQPAIAAPDQALHLHGYQPATLLGGHIGRAAARQVTATAWPLREVVARRGRLQGPKAGWRPAPPIGARAAVAGAGLLALVP